MELNTLNFTTELYGISQPSPNVLNSQKRLYMPVWAEDDAFTFLFDGWYVPQTVEILEGTAEIIAGPNVTRTVLGVDYVTPSHYEVYFSTPGTVKISCSLTTLDPERTVTAIRDFFVSGEQ
jgi:hypothetical protein